MIMIETNTMNINYNKGYIEYMNITLTKDKIKNNMKLMIRNKILIIIQQKSSINDNENNITFKRWNENENNNFFRTIKNQTVLKIKIKETYVIIQLIKKIKHTINNNLIILINEKYKTSIYIRRI